MTVEATVRVAVDRFLALPRRRNANTRLTCANALDRVAEKVGADRRRMWPVRSPARR